GFRHDDNYLEEPDKTMIAELFTNNALNLVIIFGWNRKGEFRLTMTRGDIGNYLGLTVETISRLLGRFQKSGMLAVKGKYITIENNDALAQLAGHTRNVA
ncbi:fumarate/nitrate reduction transcriptional regulator, partial [Escherichia coli ECC-1470]